MGGVHRGIVIVMVVLVVKEVQRHPPGEGITAKRQSMRHSVMPSSLDPSFHGRDRVRDWWISASDAPVTG